MTKLNLLLWILSLTLQCALLAVLAARGIARRLPVVSILIGFYVVRSMALYLLSRNPPGPGYELLFGALAAVDILLQVAVAWTLFSAIENPTPAHPSPIPTRIGIFSLLLIAAAGLAFLAARYIHANPRAPMDRGILFTSVLFTLVYLASLIRHAPAFLHRLALGFAFYALVSIAAQIGRAVTGLARNATLFHRWSYATPLAYLAVLLFWLLTLPSLRKAPFPQSI